MSYPDLFKRAAMLWWRTRLLWPLGMLAALVGAGEYGTANFNSSSNFTSTDGDVPPELVDQLAENELLRAFVENPAPFLIGATLVGLLALLITTLIGQLAHAAMIRVADVTNLGYKATLGDAMSVGVARLLPMFLLNLLATLPGIVIVIVILVGVGTLLAQVFAGAVAGDLDSSRSLLAVLGGTLLCVVPLLLLMALLATLLSFFIRLGQRACVIEGLGTLNSLRRAWALLRRGFGIALLNWVALLMLTSLFSLVASAPAAAVAFPAFFQAASSGEIPWAVLIGLGIYGFLVTVLLGGILTSFNSTLWTVVYRSLAEREASAALPVQEASAG